MALVVLEVSQVVPIELFAYCDQYKMIYHTHLDSFPNQLVNQRVQHYAVLN